MESELELAKAIKHGTLDLICPEMELRVCPGYHEVALKGTGAIRADDLARLYFRVVAPFHGPIHDVLQPSKAPGEVYSAGNHVMLRAIDENGRDWRSNWMIVNLHNRIPSPNWCIQKRLTSLFHSGTRKGSSHSSVRMLIPDCPELPFDMATHSRKTVGDREISWSSSVDNHVHLIGEAEVTFRHEEDRWLSIVATQPSAFLPAWPGLLCQALGFVTVQTLTPAVITRGFNGREDLELFSGPFWRFASVMPGPVPFNGSGGAKDFWRLVELFFRYIERIEDKRLIDEVEGIRRGARGSFQTACLTLGVGIESIAKILLKDESPPTVRAKTIQELRNHIDLWLGDASLKERAKGALARLSEISAADLMYAWANRTGTPCELVDGWKKLRHPKAHGKPVNEEQVGYDVYYSSLELMYRIVASAVGYDGPIVPTSRPGWVDTHPTEEGGSSTRS
jgi:hypothetical protein